MTYLLINKLTTQPGKRNEVTQILLTSGAAFDDQEACLMSLVSHDTNEDDIVWVQDVWTDRAAHERAMADPRMQEYVRAAIPLLAGMPEQHEIVVAGGKIPFDLG